MSTQAKYIALLGSHRNAVPGSTVIGPAHPDQRIEVTVRLRARAAIPHATWLAATAARHPRDRRYLTREHLADFARRYFQRAQRTQLVVQP